MATTTATTVARPSTPLPHTHALHHLSADGSMHSFSPPHNAYFAHPLHFSPRVLPIHTPPSLLNRTPSSSSTASHTRKQSSQSSSALAPSAPTSSVGPLPIPTPASSYHRRSSPPSLCESTTYEDESPLPQTPPSSSHADMGLIGELDFELELPEHAFSQKGFAMPEPEYNWVDKKITPYTSFDVDFNLPPRSRSPVQKLVRPKIKRRDSPRPPFNFLRMSPRPTSDIRTLRSAVDGGSWVIME